MLSCTSQVLVSQTLSQGGIPHKGLHDVVPCVDVLQIHQRLLQPHLSQHNGHLSKERMSSNPAARLIQLAVDCLSIVVLEESEAFCNAAIVALWEMQGGLLQPEAASLALCAQQAGSRHMACRERMQKPVSRAKHAGMSDLPLTLSRRRAMVVRALFSRPYREKLSLASVR